MGICSSQPVLPLSQAVSQLIGSSKALSGGSFKIEHIKDAKDPRFPAVVEAIARSFAGTTDQGPDTTVGWIFDCSLEPGKELAAGPSEPRRKWFDWFAKFCVLFGLSRGGVFALTENDKVIGATVAILPGRSSDMSSCEMMGLFLKAGFPPGGDDTSNVCGSINARDEVTQKAMADLQKAHVPQDMQRLYIFNLGVLPEAQGKGAGSALLSWLAEVADAEGCPAWLETSGAQHEAFYSRKGGFVVKERKNVVAKAGPKDASDSTLTLIGMLRPKSG